MEEVCEYCPECGNKSLRTIVQNGHQFEECDLCGYISGDEESIQQIFEEQEATEYEIDVPIYPLVRELNEIKGIRTVNSCGGRTDVLMLPFVDFTISDHLHKVLTNLLTSLKLSNRETVGNWYIEPYIHTELAFSLKPRIVQDIKYITPSQIREFRHDLRIIVRNLQMHRNLGWWRI